MGPSRRYLLLLALITLVAIGLRVHRLEEINLWVDETDTFNGNVYARPPVPLLDYVTSVKARTTQGVGWAGIVWLACQALGGTATVARLPAVVFGVAAVPAMFLLVWTVARRGGLGNPVRAGLLAALLATVSIVQIDFSQRSMPYAPATFTAALIILAHLTVVGLLLQPSLGKLPRYAAAWAGAAIVAVFLHPGPAPLVAASAVVLAVMAAIRFRTLPRKQRVTLAATAAMTALALLAAALLLGKHPGQGYRSYLDPYYHRLDLGFPAFLVSRTYDLMSYHLNLFFDQSLYWPRSLNPVTAPLVALCIWGWIRALSGRLGAPARQLALLGACCAVLVAAMTVTRFFPYGGVRQTLMLSPFVLAFAALGGESLCSHRWGRALSLAAAAIYLFAWSFHLPHFYEARITPYRASELVDIWNRNGKLPFLTEPMSLEAIRYALRNHPQVNVDEFSENTRTPFLWISGHWSARDSLWSGDLEQRLAELGHKLELLVERQAAYPAHQDYVQSLYFPPNGLWIYKVTPN